MASVLVSVLATLRGLLRSRAALHVEVLALRHQVQVLQRSRPRRLRAVKADRCLWAWLSRTWTDWRAALVTTLSGARRGFELVKLGLDVSQGAVAKYMVRHSDPPSQTWRTFLANHLEQITAADFFVVPTPTCRMLFVLVIRALRAYVEYYSRSRTHVSLDKDAPFSRRVESRDDGDIVAIPHLGGLHHRYERRAA
jgi:putative transposase